MHDGAVSFRELEPFEAAAAAAVHAAAFGRDDEARLTLAIIEECPDTLSVAADEAGTLVAHALFFPLGGPGGAFGLAPVGVLPDRQRRGIASALLRFGLERMRERGARAVFVLGDPALYARFGFGAETARGAEVPWKGDAFQALELVPRSLAGWRGPLRYPKAFGIEDASDGP